MYDKNIKYIRCKYIPSSVFYKRFITQKLKYLGEKEGYIINDQFNIRLKNRIYSWYVDSDFLLLKFMCQRGCFREDIFEKCVLCKKEKNGIKHVVNECIELKDLRDKLTNDLNNLDNKIEKLNTLEKIEYFYYSKEYTEKKEKKKKDNKGIKLIKTFIKDMYYKFGKANNKKDE